MAIRERASKFQELANTALLRVALFLTFFLYSTRKPNQFIMTYLHVLLARPHNDQICEKKFCAKKVTRFRLSV